MRFTSSNDAAGARRTRFGQRLDRVQMIRGSIPVFPSPYCLIGFMHNPMRDLLTSRRRGSGNGHAAQPHRSQIRACR
jgi:hypothetical protein